MSHETPEDGAETWTEEELRLLAEAESDPDFFRCTTCPWCGCPDRFE